MCGHFPCLKQNQQRKKALQAVDGSCPLLQTELQHPALNFGSSHHVSLNVTLGLLFDIQIRVSFWAAVKQKKLLQLQIFAECIYFGLVFFFHSVFRFRPQESGSFSLSFSSI